MMGLAGLAGYGCDDRHTESNTHRSAPTATQPSMQSTSDSPANNGSRQAHPGDVNMGTDVRTTVGERQGS